MPESPLFDFQVNGFAGVDFQRDDISVEDLRRAASALRRHGVGAIFATLVTASIDRLSRRFEALERAQAAAFHPLSAGEKDSAGVCARYAELLAELPIDLICMGNGENGHISFNDPPAANSEDRASVKTVKMDGACLQQQVNDGCFHLVAEVPSHALTLSVPVFRAARRLSIHVPGPRKAAAVRAMLEGPIETSCPASILWLHPNATLYLDPASASGLSK
jgi:glucosamine-6-phosphate deaminase